MPQLYWQKFGTGKPIVLVHGWAMHTGIWRNFAQQLGQSMQVNCVDLPGHGYSNAIKEFNLDLVSKLLVESFDQPSACWLGWSMGANIVLAIAKRFPERVNSLIFLAGNPCFTAKPNWFGVVPKILETFAQNVMHEKKMALAKFLALQIRGVANAKTLFHRIEEALNECDIPQISTLQDALNLLACVDQRSDLAKITCPSLMILGKRDNLVPSAICSKMQALAPRCNVHVLEKSGHLPFLSEAEVVTQLINNFIAEYSLKLNS